MAPLALTYRVSMPAPASHMVYVEATVSGCGNALPESLVLFMPVWTPGSYLVREYARHVEGLTAHPPAKTTKIRKNAWLLRTQGAVRATTQYRVYAGEFSVRTSHMDESHAFLVGAALFLGVEGHLQTAVRLELAVPPGWHVATPLVEVAEAASEGVRVFEAPSFDVLVDSPLELGRHRDEAFEAVGKQHRVSICSARGVADDQVRRFLRDAAAIVETLAKVFGDKLPYERYQLFIHLRSQGRGGLEHRASAALIAPASSFTSRDAYLELLSLAAHEIFHAWNVTRIKPAGLVPYRYDEECYTRLLWWFEGATSYYDWRCLALAGLCSVDEYLDHLAGEVAYLDQTPGRLVAALEDASYDAWIKLYRPDENSSNSGVSYYRKGEVVCALLDMELRMRTAGRTSLDTVLLHLWTEYGERDRPVPEDGMQGIFETVAGTPLGDLFDAWVRGTADIDYGGTLTHVGLSVERTARPDALSCSLGVRVRYDGGRAVVSYVARDSAGGRAGIDTGDEILGVAGMRVEAGNVDATLRGRRSGQVVEVLTSRDGLLTAKSVTLEPPKTDRVKIVANPNAPEAARERFAAWLGQPHPTWLQGPKAAS